MEKFQKEEKETKRVLAKVQKIFDSAKLDYKTAKPKSKKGSAGGLTEEVTCLFLAVMKREERNHALKHTPLQLILMALEVAEHPYNEVKHEWLVAEDECTKTLTSIY